MKVTAICGSARKGGNTAAIMGMVLGELNARGIETELIELYDKELHPCEGCFSCRGKGVCTAIRDDFDPVFKAMLASEGVLLGSPVYSADVSAKMKAFIERAGIVVSTSPGLLKHKVCASVAAVRRGGGLAAVDTLNHFFLNKEAILVGSTYWNMVYGREIGEVLNDEEGVKNMKNLGQNMAWVLKRVWQQG